VLVGPGIYTGPGNWNLTFRGRDLVLASEAGAEATILDGTEGQVVEARGLAFTSETRAAVVDGFTIRNFNAYEEGSGILLTGTAAPTVRNCVFRGNAVADTWPQRPQGAAIQTRETAEPLFEDCVVEANGDWGHMGSIVNVDESAVLRMADCVIAHNLGNDACIIRVVRQARAVLLRCQIVDNLPCGIYAESTLELEDCLFYCNGAPHGAGARMKAGTIRGCTFAHNNGSGGGGALEVLDDGEVTAERSIFFGNCATLGSQILVYGALRLSCCAVADSGIAADGGSWEWTGARVEEDPRFCLPGDCLWFMEGRDYHLRSDSPCLPQFSPCGERIGAYDQGCLAPEPVGACCVADTCRLLPASGCAEAGGDYQGDGASCFPDPCPGTPVERTTWGRIKAAYGAGPR